MRLSCITTRLLLPLVLLGGNNGRVLQAGSATEIWRFRTGGSVLASPSVARDGTIYVGSYDRNLHAVNPDGTLKWSFPVPPPINIFFGTYTGIYGSPVVGPDGTVYVAAENGRLHALNPTNGMQKWEYPTNYKENAIYSDPALAADGTIYFAFYESGSRGPAADHFVALNPDGTKKWSYQLPDSIFSDPVVGLDGTIYVGCDNGRLYALNPDGTPKWEFITGDYAITASAAIGSNGMIYVGVGSISNPQFFSINPDGTTNWSFTVGSRIRSTPAIGPDGAIYFGCDDHRLYALEPNGTKRWDFLADGSVGSSPALLADGTVIFGADDGAIYALDANGTLQWTFATMGPVFSSPAVGADGTIYAASDDGNLVLLRGCKPPAVNAWPMFRRNIAREGRQYPEITNQPPVLAALTDRVIYAGQTLWVTNSATDPDGPGDALMYQLAVGAPAGASVNSSNGVFSWTPSIGSTTNHLAIAVADGGTPSLTDVQCFTVTVLSRPVILSIVWSDGAAKITWSAVAGSTYRLQFTAALDGSAWTDITGDVIAADNWACTTDVAGAATQRFYRVLVVQ